MRSAAQKLGGWGNFPVEQCQIFRPERRRELEALMAERSPSDFISRGLGRSYGDASLNAGRGVILHERLGRMLAFDEASGVLECEAGVSFATVVEIFQPRGWALPTTPGTKFVTVGGAIAADVHGKNHHRVGSFSAFVIDFRLLVPDGRTLECSREKNADIFWATCGGMGLTGHLVSARFRLVRSATAYQRVDYVKTKNLDEALAHFASGDEAYEHSVCWFDCVASGSTLGRSVLMRANPAAVDDLPRALRDTPLSCSQPVPLTVPFQMPSGLLNPLTVRAFNTAFYTSHSTRSGVIVDNESFFYPLDRITHWNRLYGKRGFLQYQLLFPPATSRAGLVAVLENLSRGGLGSFLAVLKRMGPGGEGPLSFPSEGFTLALDLPRPGPSLFKTLEFITSIVVREGGRVYLAKDAVMRPDSFRAMYPSLARFQSLKRQLDPGLRVSSSLARRLGIVEGA